jgi:putative ABC transport system permease protein
MPPVTGTSARAITLDEVEVLARTVPGVGGVAPIVLGNAPVSFEARERDSVVIGTTSDFLTIRLLEVAQGSTLPDLALDEGKPVAVIGQKLKSELFDNRRAIGQWVRLLDYRFRIIGVLKGTGDSFGMDLSEAIFIPVASAQSVFNVHGLFRVMIQVRDNYQVDDVKEQVADRMQALHDGELDVTVVSPDAMLTTFDDILQILTLGVGGIAAISLVVAGILVMNVTLMSVRQRTAEIGLLKAIGAPSSQVRTLFLTEAALIATAGALTGVAAGQVLVAVGRRLYPAIPFATPPWAMFAAFVLAVGTALLFAWLPAQQAARLEPVDALGRK